MLKRILFTVVPMVMFMGTVSADDDLLKSLAALEGNTISAVAADSSASLEDEDILGQADVDALMGDDENDEDAIAACFRRVGYGYGHGYGGYNRGCYNYGYSYYRPHYNYGCYRPVTYNYCYPVTYHVPVYTSYWACY
ncbi:hypothetical protein [Rhodopirellula sp. MGV]|uniref:hypothetical protein n=1 Tax=Rhodopirellula sp. MGV TaxID=2023130 RepID=UPI000B973A8D|nr:hypothetical protein [Rhodopirellula sp. MGV]OYP36669.1 hypothetical protein CGZ80_07750 [Rhodopirellula sp. MGV]PNY36100.1 hypothetical protein C2E31_14710 [Rhodopirellula baltica]PNY36108.1 hypothetical protein C2E31_14755 [Rhodopirellula baltica]